MLPARIAKPEFVAPDADSPSVSSSSSLLHSKPSGSRASTPITDVSFHHLQDEDNFILPPPTEEMLARRRQSDLASAEIGKKLLQGWAMLADECPNTTCYGVPLVRPPKRLNNDESPPKVSIEYSYEVCHDMLINPNLMKECVVCHRVYIDAPSTSGGTHLQELSAQSPVPGPSVTSTSQTILAEHTSGPSTSRPSMPTIPLAPTLPPTAPTPSAPDHTHAANRAPFHSISQDNQPASFSVEGDNPTIFALRNAITSLTSQLDIAVSVSPSRPLDAVRVGDISNALSATLSALEKARQVLL